MDEWEPFMQQVSEGHLIFSELTHNSWEMTLHSKLTSNILECYQEKIQLRMVSESVGYYISEAIFCYSTGTWQEEILSE